MSRPVSFSDETFAAIAKGDRTAISRLLAEALPDLQPFDESGLLIEPITRGYSGASIFKVFQRDSNNPALLLRVPGDKSPDSVTQIFFKASDPAIPAAAQRAWSASLRHATLLFQDNDESPNISISEHITGQVGDAGLMNGEKAINYAFALGEAVGELHCWDSSWFEEGAASNEREVAVRSIEDMELRVHILRLGNYTRYGKCFLDTLVTEAKTEGNIEEVAGIGRALFGLLEQDSLMARLVVGHGDLKYDNTIIRSSSTNEQPELVLVDYDRVMRLPAAADLGCYLHDPGPRNRYPALANRRALAEGYLRACTASGLSVSQFSGHEIDEVVLAMEVGLLIRSLWLSTIMTTMVPKYRFVVPILREGLIRAANLIMKSRDNSSLREQILVRGSSQVIGRGFVFPLLFRKMSKLFSR